MSDNKWTMPNRLEAVIKREIKEVTIGSVGGPKLDMVTCDDHSKLKDGDPVWMVWGEFRTGMDKTGITVAYFASEQEARTSDIIPPAGTVFGSTAGSPMRLRKFFDSYSGGAAGALSLLFSVGSADSVFFDCYHALVGAGVKNESNFETAPKVLEWVGDEDIAWMQKEFGENWSALAEYEYCLHHFPKSSLATLAAHLFVSEFITYDDFAAGYLTKQIEAIVGGTEKAAMSSTELRKKAGEGGARASRERRSANLEILMKEIEKLASAVGVISEDRIVEQAFEAAREHQPNFPKSKKTLDDYGTALRSEEPFKSRYEAVFRKNA